MAEISTNLLNMLTEFVICEIGGKAMDGVTYTLLFKDKQKDMTVYNRYQAIRKEALKCGFSGTDVFRVYEVSNGYIMDMDLAVEKQIASKMMDAIGKIDGSNTQGSDVVGDIPEQRRKKDMISLAKYLKQNFDMGKKSLEVALYNRNSSNRIIISGKLSTGESVGIRYNAYAVRHWDLETINAKLLIPAGFRISRIKPCEILPSKTGVSFVITMESMEEAEEYF